MKINDDDYFRRVKNFDEIFQNERVKQFIATELNCEVVSIFSINELDGMYYLSGRVSENGEIFVLKIMLSANEKYKNLAVRKESISTSSFVLLDVVYSSKTKSAFSRTQKGSLQDKKYYLVESLIDDGSYISYQSDLYNYCRVKSLIQARGKTMYSIDALRKYSIDRLIIDNKYHDDINEYKICHNGKSSYITSDNLEETVDDLLSNNVHITLNLK